MREAVARAPAGIAGTWAERALRRPLAVLSLLCLIVFVPGLASLPVLDRDEARFAQASKQMVESGNWVDIRFGSESRYKKPIGIYWLQAAATRALGTPPYTAIWTYRLVSLAGAWAAVLLAYWTFLALAPPAASLTGAGLLALTLGLASEAHIAKTDAMLLAAVLLSQGVLARLYLAGRGAGPAPGTGLVLCGWAGLAAGILLKGPVIVAVAGLTAVSLAIADRRWAWLKAARPLTGLGLTLGLVLPWFIVIGIASHGQFFAQALGHDLGGKLAGGQESHGAPPGYFLLLTTLTLWPATLGMLPGLAAGFAARTSPAMRLLLAWIVPNWLLFEAVPTKLPHYVLPVYPALALLAGLWLTSAIAAKAAWPRYAAAVQFALGAVLLAAGAAYAPSAYGAGTPAVIAIGALACGIAGIAAAILLWRGRRLSALAAAMLSAIILYPLLMWGVAPRLSKLWLSPKLAAAVIRISGPREPPVILSGFDEPSAIFLLGTRTEVALGAEAAGLALAGGNLVLADQHEAPAFLAAIAAARHHARALATISGLNYSRGRTETITLYRVTR